MSEARIVSGIFTPSKGERSRDCFRVRVRLGFRAPKDTVGSHYYTTQEVLTIVAS